MTTFCVPIRSLIKDGNSCVWFEDVMLTSLQLFNGFGKTQKEATSMTDKLSTTLLKLLNRFDTIWQEASTQCYQPIVTHSRRVPPWSLIDCDIFCSRWTDFEEIYKAFIQKRAFCSDWLTRLKPDWINKMGHTHISGIKQ